MTGHDIEIIPLGAQRVTARCRRHGTRTTEVWTRPAEACADFTCDPSDDRFVIEIREEDTVVVMADRSGLTRVVRTEARTRAEGTGHFDIRAYLWQDGGTAELLTVDYTPGSWSARRPGGEIIVSAARENPEDPGQAAPAPSGLCTCWHDCGDCPLTGRWHVHAGDPCQVHPDAPGERR